MRCAMHTLCVEVEDEQLERVVRQISVISVLELLLESWKLIKL
jgi:hypothetical protein